MKNQQEPQWILFVFLSMLDELLLFKASRGVLAVEQLSRFCLSKLRARRTSALRVWNRMLGIRVEKRVPSDSVPPCMKNMIFLIIAGLAAMSWLTTPESILQLNATDTTGEKAYGSASPYHDTPLPEPTYGVGHCAGGIPGRPKPPRIPSNTDKRQQQETVTKPLSAPYLVATTLESSPALHEDMEVVTGQPSNLTPIVPPTGSSTDDDIRIHRQAFTASASLRPSETPTSPVGLESPRTTVAIGDAAPYHLFLDQPMITSMPTPETSLPIADSPSTPQQPYVPVTRPVSQLQPGDLFAVQSQGSSMSAPTHIPTGQVSWSRGRSSGGAHSGDNVDVECSHMSNSVELNTGNVVGSDAVTETLSMNGELSRDALTPTTSSGMPNTSPNPPQADQQPYRPRFQPPSPPVQRSIEAEQPWSPEHPTTPARQDKINDEVSKCDALFNTRTES